MILTVCSLVTAYITLLLVIFIVKKDIENKYKTKIEFPFYMTISPWSFINKYGNIAISVVMIYLIEKKIIKKTKYYNYIFLTNINYSALKEKKSNIIICFLNLISILLFAIFFGISFYIGSHVFKM